jgi:alkylated DNA nucleotide flippase Atl1
MVSQTKSQAFVNLRYALIAAVQAIPAGKVVTLGLLSSALNVPPRHVAFLLSKLEREMPGALPQHRVIPKGGDFGPPAKRTVARTAQIAALCAEGHTLSADQVLLLEPYHHHTPDPRHQHTIWATGPATGIDGGYSV